MFSSRWLKEVGAGGTAGTTTVLTSLDGSKFSAGRKYSADDTDFCVACSGFNLKLF